MAWLTSFLTSLLADIIRPIIREEIQGLKNFIDNQVGRKEIYEKYDREAQELIERMASASTSEERWAILQELKNSRPIGLNE